MEGSVVGVGTPSNAELMQRIKQKLANHEQVIWPSVTEKIEKLKALKNEKARQNPDREYRTVFHIDLHRALVSGTIVDVGQATHPEDGWTVTVKGFDSNEEELIVMVHCCGIDSRPLHITDFTIPQEKT
jgi:hypothetical protein